MGIHEALQEDEQSPDPFPKRLPSIQEETKHYIFPKKLKSTEHSIMNFLDKMNIQQIFPGEVNSMKLLY